MRASRERFFFFLFALRNRGSSTCRKLPPANFPAANFALFTALVASCILARSCTVKICSDVSTVEVSQGPWRVERIPLSTKLFEAFGGQGVICLYGKELRYFQGSEGLVWTDSWWERCGESADVTNDVADEAVSFCRGGSGGDVFIQMNDNGRLAVATTDIKKGILSGGKVDLGRRIAHHPNNCHCVSIRTSKEKVATVLSIGGGEVAESWVIRKSDTSEFSARRIALPPTSRSSNYVNCASFSGFSRSLLVGSNAVQSFKSNLTHPSCRITIAMTGDIGFGRNSTYFRCPLAFSREKDSSKSATLVFTSQDSTVAMSLGVDAAGGFALEPVENLTELGLDESLKTIAVGPAGVAASGGKVRI